MDKTSQFDNVFSNLKAETLRNVMRDLGQKNLGQGGRRTDMIDYLKNAVFGETEEIEEEDEDEEQEKLNNSKATRSTRAATRSSISAPIPSRFSRKRKSYDSEEEEDNDSNDAMFVDDSISASTSQVKRGRGRPRKSVPESDLDVEPTVSRGRGRPRKVIKVADDNEEEEDEPAVTESRVTRSHVTDSGSGSRLPPANPKTTSSHSRSRAPVSTAPAPSVSAPISTRSRTAAPISTRSHRAGILLSPAKPKSNGGTGVNGVNYLSVPPLPKRTYGRSRAQNGLGLRSVSGTRTGSRVRVPSPKKAASLSSSPSDHSSTPAVGVRRTVGRPRRQGPVVNAIAAGPRRAVGRPRKQSSVVNASAAGSRRAVGRPRKQGTVTNASAKAKASTLGVGPGLRSSTRSKPGPKLTARANAGKRKASAHDVDADEDESSGSVADSGKRKMSVFDGVELTSSRKLRKMQEQENGDFVSTASDDADADADFDVEGEAGPIGVASPPPTASTTANAAGPASVDADGDVDTAMDGEGDVDVDMGVDARTDVGIFGVVSGDTDKDADVIQGHSKDELVEGQGEKMGEGSGSVLFSTTTTVQSTVIGAKGTAAATASEPSGSSSSQPAVPLAMVIDIDTEREAASRLEAGAESHSSLSPSNSYSNSVDVDVVAPTGSVPDESEDKVSPLTSIQSLPVATTATPSSRALTAAAPSPQRSTYIDDATEVLGIGEDVATPTCALSPSRVNDDVDEIDEVVARQEQDQDLHEQDSREPPEHAANAFGDVDVAAQEDDEERPSSLFDVDIDQLQDAGDEDEGNDYNKEGEGGETQVEADLDPEDNGDEDDTGIMDPEIDHDNIEVEVRVEVETVTSEAVAIPATSGTRSGSGSQAATIPPSTQTNTAISGNHISSSDPNSLSPSANTNRTPTQAPTQSQMLASLSKTPKPSSTGPSLASLASVYAYSPPKDGADIDADDNEELPIDPNDNYIDEIDEDVDMDGDKELRTTTPFEAEVFGMDWALGSDGAGVSNGEASTSQAKAHPVTAATVPET